jgi:hemoglobin-like flavoprotein
MDARKIALLRESWALIPWKSEALSANFYIHLFNVDPLVQTAYAGNKLRPISGMLGFMGAAIAFLDDPDSLKNMLRQASERHAGYGALTAYYPALGQAVLLTLEGAAGEKFTPETRQAWTEFYQFMSDCMTQSGPQTPGHRVDSTDMALHLDDLLEDPGPQSAHLPLFEAAEQGETQHPFADASVARKSPANSGRLHLHRQ